MHNDVWVQFKTVPTGQPTNIAVTCYACGKHVIVRYDSDTTDLVRVIAGCLHALNDVDCRPPETAAYLVS